MTNLGKTGKSGKAWLMATLARPQTTIFEVSNWINSTSKREEYSSRIGVLKYEHLNHETLRAIGHNAISPSNWLHKIT